MFIQESFQKEKFSQSKIWLSKNVNVSISGELNDNGQELSLQFLRNFDIHSPLWHIEAQQWTCSEFQVEFFILLIQAKNKVTPIYQFSVEKATLELQMSITPLVRQSISHQNPLTSQNHSHQPSCLLTIEPIDHQAYQPSSLSTIEPIDILSSFATFKPFGLF